MSIYFLVTVLATSCPVSHSLFLGCFPSGVRAGATLVLPIFVSTRDFDDTFLSFVPSGFVTTTFLRAIRGCLGHPSFVIASFLALKIVLSLLCGFFVDGLLVINRGHFFIRSCGCRSAGVSGVFFLCGLHCLTGPS